MLIRKCLSEELLNKGIDLSSQGIREIIWNGSNIKDVINNLYASKKVILGGDVYTVDGSNFASATCDNWYYNGKSHEESYHVAFQYIEKYVKRNGDKFYFSVTI